MIDRRAANHESRITNYLKAFTFIELLIAVSIFAVVAIALYSTFFAGISVWKRSGAGGNISQNVMFIFGGMTRELKNSVYGSKDPESIFAFSGAPDEIVFVTLESTYSEKSGAGRELVRVSYSFDKDEGQLVRREADLSNGFDLDKAEEEVLLRGAKEIAFSYCYDTGDKDDPYEWQDTWEDKEARIPRGIKVTSEVKAEKEKALKFTKTIFIPTGILGEREVGL